MNSVPIRNAYHFCPRCATANANPGSIPFRCSHCDLSLFFGPVAAVGGLIVNAQNQLLLVRRAKNPGKGKWGLPGGFVDHDETIEDALQREIREETNLQVRDMRYLMSRPNQYSYDGVIAPVIDLFFECRVDSVESFLLCQTELDGHLWVRPKRTHLENMAFESNRIAVESWLSANQ